MVDAQAVFLAEYFERLNRHNLGYAVMRNFDGLPNRKTGNDIDILVAPAEIDKHSILLRRIAATHGWTEIQAVYKPYIRVHKFCKVGLDEAKFPSILHFDFFPFGSWYGTRFMNAEIALARRRRLDSEPVVCVLNDEDALFHLICHHMLYTGTLKKTKYIQQLHELPTKMVRKLKRELEVLFGVQWANRVWQTVWNGESLSSNERTRLRFALVLHRGAKGIVVDLATWLKSGAEELRSRKFLQGALISMSSEVMNHKEGMEEFLEWLIRMCRFNHAFLDDGLNTLAASNEKPVLDRLYRHYGRPAQLTWEKVRFCLSRGWVVCIPQESEPSTIVNRAELIITTDSDANYINGSARSKVVKVNRDGDSISFKKAAESIIEVLRDKVKIDPRTRALYSERG